MATTPSPNMIRVNVPMNSADNSPHRPCRPNVCRPAPCIGRYSSAMPNPPIGRPSDNLAHLWKTGATPAPAARHSPHAPDPPYANLRPSPGGGCGPAGLDALAIIRYRWALSTHFSECPTDQVGYPDAAADSIDSTRRPGHAPAVRAGSPPQPRGAVGADGPAQRDGLRDPAHPPAGRIRREGPGLGEVPARSGAAPPWQHLSGRQRAALPGAQLGGLAGRSQQRDGEDRHPSRRPGAGRSPRLPPR